MDFRVSQEQPGLRERLRGAGLEFEACPREGGPQWDQSHELLVCRDTPPHLEWVPGGKLPFCCSFSGWKTGRKGQVQKVPGDWRQGDPMSPFPRKTGWELSALFQRRFSSPTGEFLCPEALFEQGMRTLGWPSTENHKRH